MLTSKSFWVDAAERGVATGAQVLLAFFVAGATVADFDWKFVGTAVATAVAASVLKSVVAGATSPGAASASLVQRQILDAEIASMLKGRRGL